MYESRQACRRRRKAEDAVRRGKAYLVLISKDASANTEKKYADMCSHRGLRLLKAFGDRYEFGRAVGREFAVVAAVTDKGFSQRISELSERVGK